MIKLIAIGASFGGLDAIRTLLFNLPPENMVPVIVTLHIGQHSISHFIGRLNRESRFFIREAADKMKLKKQSVYFAPPDYHLLVENDLSITLSLDEKVNYSRPSIDVMFQSAAWSQGPGVIGVLLTGANQDGALGLKTISQNGGFTIVQDPTTAVSRIMPQSAINLFKPDSILPLENIAEKIVGLIGNQHCKL